MNQNGFETVQNMDEDRLKGIIYALSNDIHDLYGVNVETRAITAYRKAGLAKGVAESMAIRAPYADVLEAYIVGNVHPDDWEVLRAEKDFDYVLQQLEKDSSLKIHYRVNRGGEIHYFYMRILKDGEGENFKNVIMAFAQEDAHINRSNRLKALEVDELTGLMSRQAFFLRAKELLEENPEDTYDLTIADIDNFKLINSYNGEKVGDDVLKCLADFFRENTVNGIVARYGGDQFVGFAKTAPDRQREWLLEMIKKVQAMLPNVIVKFGVYSNVDRNISVSAMVDRALMAVKSIKHNFAVPYARYDGPISKQHEMRQTFETAFSEAIKNRQFVVWYQPKFDAKTEELVGAEALVRWKTPDGKFISPGAFIPTFEEDGLIVQLDEYVFRTVCETYAAYGDRIKVHYPISVNLSRASLHQEGTVERYKKILEETGVSAKEVPLELTESAAIHSEAVRNRMRDLREAGFELHMDDFGSGESSLSSLNILPFNVMKIDKSLIDSVGDEGGDELLRHIVSLAHFKKMQVIAEGVEKKEQLDFLRTLGVEEIQGYYYSAPRPLEDALPIFEKGALV